MSDYDKNARGPVYNNRVQPTARSSGSWIVGAIVAILVIIALGYAFSDRWMTGNSGMVEHRAAATSTPEAAPAATPASPQATPKP